MTQAPALNTSPTNGAARDPEDRMIYVNGQMVPRSEAKIGVYDHGLLYGDGVFEGLRIYNGKIFKLRAHTDRLYESASRIHLDLEEHVPYDEMLRIQKECVAANGIKEGYIRLVITRGEGTLGLNPFMCPEPGVICIADSITLYTAEMYAKGMRVLVAERPRIPVAALDPRIKSLNYLNNILAKTEALRLNKKLGITDPGDQLLEVLMLNTEGRVSEGSGDNLFVIKGGELFTPPCDEGTLEGITRRFVKDELCPKLGLSCTEKKMTLDDVLAADEVFMTGSAAEIIAVREILQHKDLEVTSTHAISDGEGPVTGQIRAAFRAVVTSNNVPEN
ncbi:MAG: aminotransferase class IV [Planctomycetota bacterium]